jgi:hypothetical protein
MLRIQPSTRTENQYPFSKDAGMPSFEIGCAPTAHSGVHYEHLHDHETFGCASSAQAVSIAA